LATKASKLEKAELFNHAVNEVDKKKSPDKEFILRRKEIAHESQNSKKHTSKLAATPAIGITTVTGAAMGAAALSILFPTLAPAWIVGAFVSGLIVDSFMYTASVRSVFSLVFAEGLFRKSRNKVIFRELEEAFEDDDLYKRLRKKKSQERNMEKDRIRGYIKQLENALNNDQYAGKWDKRRLQARINESNKKLKKLTDQEGTPKFDEDEDYEIKSETLLKWEAFRDERINQLSLEFIRKGVGRDKALRYGREAWKKYWQKHKEEWDKSGDDLLVLGSKIEDVIHNRCKNELNWKKRIIRFAIASCAANGLGFGMIAFTHVHYLFFHLAFLAGAASFLGPAGVIAVAAILGILTAKVWGMVLFSDFYEAITSNKSVKDFFKSYLKKLGIAREKDKKYSTKENASFYLSAALKIFFAAIITTLAIMGTLLYGGSIMEAVGTTFDIAATTFVPVLNILAQVIVFGLMIPSDLLFAVKHGIGAGSKVANGIKSMWNKISNGINTALKSDTTFTEGFINAATAFRNDPAKYIIKYPLFFIVGAILSVALLGHIIADAAYVAGEGAASKRTWPGRAFAWMVQKLDVNPAILGIVDQSVPEAIEHSDFVMKYSKQVIKASYDIPLSGFMYIKNKLLSCQESRDMKKTVEATMVPKKLKKKIKKNAKAARKKGNNRKGGGGAGAASTVSVQNNRYAGAIFSENAKKSRSSSKKGHKRTRVPYRAVPSRSTVARSTIAASKSLDIPPDKALRKILRSQKLLKQAFK